MTDRELKLNSLSRYSKSSPLFILEEHGHCEVPAGCGGVVLRWRDPAAGVPITMWSHTGGPCEPLLDGSPVTSGRPLVPYGEHVLAFAVTEIDPAFMVLMFAGVHRSSDDEHVTTVPPEPGGVSVLSAADGTWRYTLTEPPDDAWTLPGFEDADWPSMDAVADRPPVEGSWDPVGYRIGKMTERGAVGLGVPGAPGARVRAWIRKEFTVPRMGGDR
ncbi:hypothetical protein [Thermomonospora umbrina]|uniref:Uncharacterized protein n=1 Tax=Thermomonospora umbrina TaxID=111806 RepID=A0A3D9T5J9_9ACTN|nr:hypothetical protein [Thermomonospora umbrina]REE99061.1 hypothetical protein DFJ69_4566 [Thermomonospora umbrina]